MTQPDHLFPWLKEEGVSPKKSSLRELLEDTGAFQFGYSQRSPGRNVFLSQLGERLRKRKTSSLEIAP